VSEPLAPRLDPQAIEGPIYRRWAEAGVFHVTPDDVSAGGDPYVIVIPPPNVTAVLHMGHGLNNTVQDVLIRWQRMRGRAALWVPGTDHAGIATQNVVERRLAAEGRDRFELGREPFVEEVWEFVRETGGTILEQLKAIGSSCDWDRTRFTLDPGLSRAVREVFVRLHEKGLIYRGEYIINWCPRCLTALSNEEAEGRETDGHLYDLRYPLEESAWEAAQAAHDAWAARPRPDRPQEGSDASRDGAAEDGPESMPAPMGLSKDADGRWSLTVSTTRPETMLGDTAVAVNPGDERYAGLVGATVHLPLTGRTIPIIADEFVDPAFGTGMVKVTPAHDPNDFDMGQRAGLPVLDVMTDQASMNENVPAQFRGLDRFDARKAVLEALDALGLLGERTPHSHSVPHCYRCHTVVEPRLSEQWFVRMGPLAEPALQASREGKVRFTPDRWTKVYEGWLENIRDWCISRQLWWGHRIPVWYCGECEGTHVLREDPELCPDCGSESLEQDPDVLDTWFSSWLWPFSVFGWPEESEDLRAFYPGHTLSTAPEILFFWVARMIMAGYEFMGETPFTDVYLHGTVRDRQGRKMSKSLGNGIDPLQVTALFGADALRFTLISAAAVGTDIYLDPDDLEASFAPGRNFANKVWNAGRFTLMSVGEEPVRPLDEVREDLELADRWILSRLSNTAEEMTRELERFRLHEVADLAYHFFWGDFADWYLELVKPRVRGDGGEASRQAARSTLVHVFDQTLRLLHPLIPFVTTELWGRLPWPEGAERPSDLIVAPWPESAPSHRDENAEAGMAELQELVGIVRSLRKEYGIGEGQKVRIGLTGASDRLRGTLEVKAPALLAMARIADIEFDGQSAGVIGAHSVLKSGAEVFLPLEDLIDLDRERERMGGEIRRLEGQLAGAEKKLANENFTARAPADVVEREREKAESMRDQLDKLLRKLEELGGS
jgi:valyl-tRNA synthetase